MKILILGGYGVFGGRLAELISDIPALDILIAGRDLNRARAFCDGLASQATLRPLQLDRADIAAALTAQAPDLVVDASGPFQDYGDNRYAVIKACLQARVNYLDFADGADFVFGVTQFDARARQAGIFALSGVSSFPVLTAAVLREMGKTMEIQKVTGGIAPSPYAGIGLNVMRAVVGYAGGPVKLMRGGQMTEAVGLAESLRYTIAPPGHLPLRNIHFSLVDVPDLQVIPPEHDALTDIWMGAGPVPEGLHRMLNLLAKARARLRLPSLAPLSPLFYRVLNLMKFGEHRGGMFVEAVGQRDGQKVTQSWHLLAEGDDGPYIPSMAIEALIRKSVQGQPPAPGARPATRALELADYDSLFAGRTIYTGLRQSPPPDTPLFQKVLGDVFDDLPPQVRELHDLSTDRTWVGTAKVRAGRGAIARLIARLYGFPRSDQKVPVQVRLSPKNGKELWTRTFGDKTFRSELGLGTGRNTHHIVERFGIIKVALAIVVQEGRLYLIPRRWSCLGLPLPRSLRPNGTSFETEVDGKFAFNVEIAVPLIGNIVSYEGTLSPQ